MLKAGSAINAEDTGERLAVHIAMRNGHFQTAAFLNERWLEQYGSAKTYERRSRKVLDGAQSVTEAKLMSGDVLTLHVNQVQLKASMHGVTCLGLAFAALLGDRSVVAWGAGGDCSAVQGQLKNVQQIQDSNQAFAAIRSDGSVVTWGSSDYGGDSSAVQDQLRDVQQIQASKHAFAAILGDGSVVTWGSAGVGGHSSAVHEQLRDVQHIQASEGAFAAILGDGSVVTWGNATFGGDSSAVQEQLKNVQQIQASGGAFAAILGDGSVVTWGKADYGGDSSLVQDQLRDVQQIQASSRAFAAILSDGSLVTWGEAGDTKNSDWDESFAEQLAQQMQMGLSEKDFLATANETFTELGFFSAKETVDKKRTVGALLAVFWIVASQYDQFVRGQAEGVRLSKSSWDHLQDWTRNTVCLTKSHSMVSAMLVYVAIMNVGKIKPFRAAFAPEEDEPAEALARILHRSPMLVPSFAKLEPEQQHVILSALKADFNFGQFLQAENLPASLFTVRQILAEGGAASGDILGFFLFRIFAAMSGILGPKSLEGSIFMTETNYKNFEVGLDTLQHLMEDGAVRVYDRFLVARAKGQGLHFQIDGPEHLSRKASLEVDVDESVASLARCAQSALEARTGRLLNSCGEVLDGASSIKRARLQNGDVLTLQVKQVALAATKRRRLCSAFAAILGDGSVITWSDADDGGDHSVVREQLKNVQQVQASSFAFAAILGDGSVVTWGHVYYGGDSSAVRQQLRDVQRIQASNGAFAAILGDGSVVTWGNAADGGDSSAVQDQLRDVQQIQASVRAFAAILVDGSVVTWGDALWGGDSSSVHEQLRDVQQIQASERAFAAILGDGSVVTWGSAVYGGDSGTAQDQLRDVQQMQASLHSFAAILGDGSVVTWGNAQNGGDSSAVQAQLRNVKQIQASVGAFAAILVDGSVVTWGNSDSGGDSRAVQDQLRDVQQIQASKWAFAAILDDGSVVTWGDAEDGGDSSAVQEQLKNVQHIQASGRAFAAILGDGSVMSWGHADFGGDSSAVQGQLRDVQQIQAAYGAFAAILRDGSVVTWGDADYCGKNSAAQDQNPLPIPAHNEGCQRDQRALVRLACMMRAFDSKAGAEVAAAWRRLAEPRRNRLVDFLNADGIKITPGFLLYNAPAFLDSAKQNPGQFPLEMTFEVLVGCLQLDRVRPDSDENVASSEIFLPFTAMEMEMSHDFSSMHKLLGTPGQKGDVMGNLIISPWQLQNDKSKLDDLENDAGQLFMELTPQTGLKENLYLKQLQQQFPELGFFRHTDEQTKALLRQTLARLLAVYWTATDQPEAFTRGQDIERKLSDNSWSKIRELTQNSLESGEVFNAVWTVMAVMDVARLPKFRQQLAPDCSTPTQVLNHVLSNSPKVLPSFVRMPQEAQALARDCLVSEFVFAEFIWAEIPPASVTAVKRMLSDSRAGLTSKTKYLGVFLYCVFVEMPGHPLQIEIRDPEQGQALSKAFEAMEEESKYALSRFLAADGIHQKPAFAFQNARNFLQKAIENREVGPLAAMLVLRKVCEGVKEKFQHQGRAVLTVRLSRLAQFAEEFKGRLSEALSTMAALGDGQALRAFLNALHDIFHSAPGASDSFDRDPVRWLDRDLAEFRCFDAEK
ncbi:E3 ubiquitin-protein ligase HERC2 [Symbiodinium microadriaticum]|uniref:E3 ubiquitin-protein ligase HERC2 n=1 Tax=Symbiodinium microadriaticum TaxID=2951 RepID=A0A1Q9CBJ4_SYMMI|nr:E3 ubiquitin-protein ligase HERC2 [Symbiodinium microadriaticum]